MNNVLHVYEYEKIPVGFKRDGVSFANYHFEHIASWNEQHGNRYLSTGYKSVTFSKYVGVIRVGDLTIEVLPKIERYSDNNLSDWSNFLLDMLVYCKRLKLHESSRAQLSKRKHSLFEIYIYHFLSEVELIISQGLVRKYRIVEGNRKKFKGKLNIEKQLVLNAVHKERFYVSSAEYDYNNIFNRILKLALQIVQNMSSLNNDIIERCNDILILFEEINSGSIDWGSINYDRNTERYREAIKLAEYIIKSFTPDIIQGRTSVIAFLFDMNQLYEEYLYSQCRIAIKEFPDARIFYQKGKQFWGYKRIIPDFSVSYQSKNYILDAKWKVVHQKPHDNDLKQMFIYNVYWNSNAAYLIYPSSDSYNQDVTGELYKSILAFPNYQHGTYMLPVNIISNGNLNKNVGASILKQILK